MSGLVLHISIQQETQPTFTKQNEGKKKNKKGCIFFRFHPFLFLYRFAEILVAVQVSDTTGA
jgi:hypothetical protein